MKNESKYWQFYYTGTPDEVDFKMAYGYSDRARYYLLCPEVKAAIEALSVNLSAGIPEGLISQYLPAQYRDVRAGRLEPTSTDLLISRVSRSRHSILTPDLLERSLTNASWTLATLVA